MFRYRFPASHRSSVSITVNPRLIKKGIKSLRSPFPRVLLDERVAGMRSPCPRVLLAKRGSRDAMNLSYSLFLLTFVRKSVKIRTYSPAGESFSGEPHIFVSADTRQKSSFVNSLGAKRKPLRAITMPYAMRNARYEIPDTRYASRNCPLHLWRTLYKSPLFMQNKPNFKTGQMNATFCFTRNYENRPLQSPGKQSQFKAKTNPIQTQSPKSLK